LTDIICRASLLSIKPMMIPPDLSLVTARQITMMRMDNEYNTRFTSKLAVPRLFLKLSDAESSSIRQHRISMFPGKPCRTFLNSDSPTLPCIQIDEAITAPRADGDHVVLGPSFDGGYVLIGLKGFHPELFPISSGAHPPSFAATRKHAAQMGLPVHVPYEWYDVDKAEDFGASRLSLMGSPPSLR
jgi:glycosyltransferase A (GT-A) superfamily protein (DUF2064 family)